MRKGLRLTQLVFYLNYSSKFTRFELASILLNSSYTEQHRQLGATNTEELNVNFF